MSVSTRSATIEVTTKLAIHQEVSTNGASLGGMSLARAASATAASITIGSTNLLTLLRV
jgi:poly(3-hydroxyalkanoate) synthetase